MGRKRIGVNAFHPGARVDVLNYRANVPMSCGSMVIPAFTDTELVDVAQKILSTLPGGDRYFILVSDMKRLTGIIKKLVSELVLPWILGHRILVLEKL